MPTPQSAANHLDTGIISPLTVLVVDDNALFIETMLRQIGTFPWVKEAHAVSGETVFDRVEDLEPDLVLMDIVMPGINGLDLTKRLKTRYPHIWVIVVSVFDYDEYRTYAGQVGADGFISKPKLADELEPMIAGMFGQRPPQVSSVPPQLQLDETETYLRLVMQSTEMGIWDWDLETGRLSWTAEHAGIFGIPPDAFDGTYAGFVKFVHPEDAPALEQAIAQAGEAHKRFEHQYRILRPDGEIRWMFARGEFVYREDGWPARMHGIVLDITANHEAQLHIADREARLRTLLGACDSQFVLIHTDNTIERLDEEFASKVSPPVLAFRGSTLLEDIKPAYHSQVLALLDTVRQGGCHTIEYEATAREDQTPIWIELRATLLDSPLEHCVLGIARDISHRKAREAQLNYLSDFDSLTGLPNRNLFSQRLQQVLADTEQREQMAAVILLGLDRFKMINDSLGHPVGDKLLCEAADRLSYVLRSCDTVARMSGDEFGIVMPELEHIDDAERYIEKIIHALAAPFYIKDDEVHLSTSIGFIIYPIIEGDMSTLLRNADIAMNYAKEVRGSSYSLYTREMTASVEERVRVENALRHAIAGDELTLFYQPKVELCTGQVIGVEALLRWESGALGSVSPGVFIPVAEETGLITSIGHWVLREACRQLRVWADQGLDDVSIAVNISSRQFHETDIVQQVEFALAETGVPAARLQLELTESLLLHNVDENLDKLNAFHAMGVKVAIDDFGTGYSSLAYLQRFPIDILKIDRSFVQALQAENGRAIAKTIISMGQILGMQVIAEGVETAEELAFLKDNGCHAMQGFYFSKPLPADQVEHLFYGNEAMAKFT